MTTNQRIALQAEWWPAACSAQGWRVNDRDLRIRVCAWAVSLANPDQLALLEAINSDRTPARFLESTNDLDSKEDIDAVKACLGMLADNLQRTREVGQPHYGAARRKRDVIRAHLKCLALFEPHPRRFLAHLVRDMFGARLGPDVTIRELTDDGKFPSNLQRLLMRVSQIVNDKRKANQLVPAYKHLQGTEPMSIHEMKLTAGVTCDCAVCEKIRAKSRKPVLPAILAPENWSDLEPELESAGAGGSDEPNPF